MRPLSVLFTNNALDGRAGSETYVRDVATALLRRGHRPIAFSLVLGEMAADLRRATIPVIDDLSRLASPPDVIHGHHHLETLIAALTFPDTPIVHFCHGWVPWEEMPLQHPAIRRYVAVDEVCLDRLVCEEGISPDQIDVVRNFVDLDRFHPRPPLPAHPVRALVLSNYATADGYARVIASACEAVGISVDVVGSACGNATDAPETVLPGYDLVFAKGRTALEAMAVGCAVILADAAGAGPLVTPPDFERLRARNFGVRELRHSHDVGWYREQIAACNPSSAADVCARVRAEAGLESAVDRLLEIYASAMGTPAGAASPTRSAAEHLARIARPLKQAHALTERVREQANALAVVRAERATLATEMNRQAHAIQTLTSQVESLGATCEAVGRELDAALAAERALGSRLTALQSALARQTDLERESSANAHHLEAARERIGDLEGRLAAFAALPTLRLRDAMLHTPVLGTALQVSARRLVRLLGSSNPDQS